MFDLEDKNEMIGWKVTFPMWHIGQMNEEHNVLEDFEIEDVGDIFIKRVEKSTLFWF